MIPNELDEYEEEPEESTTTPGWFGSPGKKIDAFTTSFAKLARETIPSAGSAVRQTLDGITDAITRSASDIANEFAEMERESRVSSEREKMEEFMIRYMREREQQSLHDFVECCKIAFSKLPWEVWRPTSTTTGGGGGGAVGEDSSNVGGGVDNATTPPIRRGEFVEDRQLKANVLSLSLEENTFTEPFLDGDDVMVMDENKQYGSDLEYDAQYCYYEKKEKQTEQMFLDQHAGSIRRLLEIDENLSRMHTQLVAGRSVKESVFWRNYFYHCERLRGELSSKQKQKRNCGGAVEEESSQHTTTSADDGNENRKSAGGGEVDVTDQVPSDVSTTNSNSIDPSGNSPSDKLGSLPPLSSPANISSPSSIGTSSQMDGNGGGDIGNRSLDSSWESIPPPPQPAQKAPVPQAPMSSGSLVLIGADGNELKSI